MYLGETENVRNKTISNWNIKKWIWFFIHVGPQNLCVPHQVGFAYLHCCNVVYVSVLCSIGSYPQNSSRHKTLEEGALGLWVGQHHDSQGAMGWRSRELAT